MVVERDRVGEKLTHFLFLELSNYFHLTLTTKPTLAYSRGHYWMPMTPQATRVPACPVVRLSLKPPLPRSSESLCTTTARPRMLYLPTREMILSVIMMSDTPFSSARMLPRSPACLASSLGPPWFF